MTDEKVKEAPQEYRKTATIRAVQYTGQYIDGVCTGGSSCKSRGAPDDCVPHIHTLEGDLTVSPGDWIATGVKGEHWAIKPDVFAASYEPVSAPPSTPTSAPVEDVGGLVEKLQPLIAKCATYGWRGVESTMFRVTSEQAKALCDLADLARPQDRAVPPDVARLVVAARIVAHEDQCAGAMDELDQAAEAFAARVRWDDEPTLIQPQGEERS